VDFILSLLRGWRGGINVTWDMAAVKINVFHRSSQMVAIVISEPNRSTWFFCGVYARTAYWERRVVWEEVSLLVD